MTEAKIKLTRVSDGLVREITQDCDSEEGMEYMGMEGNYSCDCNRHLFFEREGGREPPDDEPGCGEGMYKVVVKLGDRVIYQEE